MQIETERETWDFTNPTVTRLSDTDEFAVALDDTARYYARELDACSQFLPDSELPEGYPEELREFFIGAMPKVARFIQGRMALFQPVAASEFKRTRAIVPAAPQFLLLREKLDGLLDRVPRMPLDRWPIAAPPAGPILGQVRLGPHEPEEHTELVSIPRICEAVPYRFMENGFLDLWIDSLRRDHRYSLFMEIATARRATDTIARLFGSPEVWVKNPSRTTCAALIRSLQSREIDAEDFLAWLGNELGLGTKYHPYIARVLFGVRRKDGELVVPGDMTVVRSHCEFRLNDVPDELLYREVVDLANSAYAHDEHPIVKSQTLTGGEEIDEENDLLEIAALFDSSIEIEDGTAMMRAAVDSGKRKTWREIGKAAGLNRRETEFLIKLESGAAVKRDNPTAYQAIYRRRDAIERAKASAMKRVLESAGGERYPISPSLGSTYKEWFYEENESGEARGTGFMTAMKKVRDKTLVAFGGSETFPVDRFNPDAIPSPEFTGGSFSADPRAAVNLISLIEAARESRISRDNF